jgi:hypothetical protein
MGWKEIVIEKCRRMGYHFWSAAWVFITGYSIKDFSMLMGTLNENKISNSSPGHDTLFAKLRDYPRTPP